MLQQKLAQIEKKIIVGGENLLEKAEEQEKLLEESAKELEDRRQKAESLRKALEEKEVTLASFSKEFLARNFEGQGNFGRKEQILGDAACYYAYHKMIATSMVFVKILWGQSRNLGGSCPSRPPCLTCLVAWYSYIKDSWYWSLTGR